MSKITIDTAVVQQVAEPFAVWNFGSDRENENGTVIVTMLGATHPATTDQFITLQSHREAMAKAVQMLTDQDYEYNRKTNALIKRHGKQVEGLRHFLAQKDAALDACVESLLAIYDRHNADSMARARAAIDLAKKAMGV